MSCVTCHMSHVTLHNPKLLELGTWNFKTMFTTPHVSHVTCHVSCVTCQFIYFWKRGGASWWRVCYQRSLSHLVSDTHLCPIQFCLFQEEMSMGDFPVHPMFPDTFLPQGLGTAGAPRSLIEGSNKESGVISHLNVWLLSSAYLQLRPNIRLIRL